MAARTEQDTEIHRQHVRLRVPIAVEIDGQRYPVDDWSIGGFGVVGALPRRRPGERFAVRLVLPFEDFELALDLEAELVYRLEDEPRFGCRFVRLSAGQLALFRRIVEGYLSGEIVGADELLAVRVHERAPQDVLVESPRSGASRLRRLFGFTLAGLAALALFALAWLGFRERWLVVRAEGAVVEAPIVRVLAPTAGRVEPREVDPVLAPGARFGVVRLDGGAEVALASPCECALVGWLVDPGRPVAAGEPVALLAAVDRPLLVRANVAASAVRRLAPGDRAEIGLPFGLGTVRGRIERIDLRPQLSALAAGDPLTAARRPLSVLIRPERPLDFELLGAPVEVRFD
ncbi:MAG: PilZ domain-containing protein [Geminicoccaceae bacterium]|nr:alginate biosynthesis protein Alg44 [Geminicoccaceae bacterium]MDW8124812.1 PilZ domain-containing protein [Geminicoccaceae bacterium]MDW8340664.1 PilZ domain-containing protein [Geminicoccaceae bacterium]